MDIPYFSEAEVAGFLDYCKLIDLMGEAMVEHSQGRVISPIRQMLPIEEISAIWQSCPSRLPPAWGPNWLHFTPRMPDRTPHASGGNRAF